ncbi:hypothetical protein JW698_01855 [Candidatus Wolfebacteria bacterium]|nr:hypothetical protein [Candidatus Wolfebacteria bacterium]
MSEKKPIGEVTHYFDNLGVAIVKFLKAIKVGQVLNFKGGDVDFTQEIDSMQYDHKDIKSAKKGQEVGIKISQRVKEGYKVYEA